MNIPWWGYVIGAGLAWGTYVPIVFFGGQMLTGDLKTAPLGGRLASILCVGIAYFILAVLIPVALMMTRSDAKPDWKPVGLVFSGLAGVAGAVGAICVIFASKAATDAARAEGITNIAELAKYRMYIAPLIFCLAPIINTLLSTVWHPNSKTGEWMNFHLEMPNIKMWIGIALAAAGTFLVLMSKEEAEKDKLTAKPAVTTPATTPNPTPSTNETKP
jgi:drug/metabolite transporter (DMT)-like permease